MPVLKRMIPPSQSDFVPVVDEREVVDAPAEEAIIPRDPRWWHGS